jgi:hypothetical protein
MATCTGSASFVEEYEAPTSVQLRRSRRHSPHHVRQPSADHLEDESLLLLKVRL